MVVVPDEGVWPGAQQIEPGRPASHAGALAFVAFGPPATQLAGQHLELQLGRRGAVVLIADHVEHHLHACADALDEVGLGHEVAARPEVELVRR